MEKRLNKNIPTATINAVQSPMVQAFHKAREEFNLGLEIITHTKTGQLNGNENLVLGKAFEEYHRGTFAMDAAAKGVADKVEVATDTIAGNNGSILPRNDQQADIMVKIGDETTLYQAKSMKTASGTNTALNNAKYEEVNKLGPSDQVDDSQSTINHTVDGKEVQSKPMTREQNEQITKELKENDGQSTTARQTQIEIQKEMAFSNTVSAVKQAALVTAVITGVVEIVDLIKLSQHQELFLDDMAKVVEKVTLTTVDASLRTGLTVYISQSTAESASQTLFYGALVNVAYDLAKDLFKFSKSEICLDQVGVNVLKNGLSTGASFVGGANGQALGTVASTTLVEAIGIGATLGSVAGPVGSVVGALILGTTMGLGVNQALADQSRLAQERIQKDLDNIRDSLMVDDRFIQMKLRANVFGRLAPIEPQGWRDLVPFLNIFGDMDEYLLRKQELNALRIEAEQAQQQSAIWKKDVINDINIQADMMRSDLIGKFEESQALLKVNARAELSMLGQQLKQYQRYYQMQLSLQNQEFVQSCLLINDLQSFQVKKEYKLLANTHLLVQMAVIPDALDLRLDNRKLLSSLANKIANDGLHSHKRSYVSVTDVLLLME